MFFHTCGAVVNTCFEGAPHSGQGRVSGLLEIEQNSSVMWAFSHWKSYVGMFHRGQLASGSPMGRGTIASSKV